MGEQIHSLPTDEIFDALSDVHRRRVLVSLLDHNPQPVQIAASSQDTHGMNPELLDEFLRMNTGLLDEFLTGPLKVNGADKETIRLHHHHLPKLVDYGFIEWNRDENEIQKGPKFDKIRPLLVLLEENRETVADDWL